MKGRIPAELVKVLWDYDPTTGLLVWKIAVGRHGRIAAGTAAGSVHTDQDGYRCRYVTFSGVQYKASHLIWVWMTGKWPKRTVDHRDLDGLNDRWDNLREADDSQQKQNNRRRRDSGTGFKCVVRCSDADARGGRYFRWQIVVEGKRVKSGQRFATPEEAHADYCVRLPSFHGEFARET